MGAHALQKRRVALNPTREHALWAARDELCLAPSDAFVGAVSSSIRGRKLLRAGKQPAPSGPSPHLSYDRVSSHQDSNMQAMPTSATSGLAELKSGRSSPPSWIQSLVEKNLFFSWIISGEIASGSSRRLVLLTRILSTAQNEATAVHFDRTRSTKAEHKVLRSTPSRGKGKEEQFDGLVMRHHREHDAVGSGASLPAGSHSCRDNRAIGAWLSSPLFTTVRQSLRYRVPRWRPQPDLACQQLIKTANFMACSRHAQIIRTH